MPSGDKEAIVEELGLLSVTRESLLPGLDEAANAITRRYTSRHRSEPTGRRNEPVGEYQIAWQYRVVRASKTCPSGEDRRT